MIFPDQMANNLLVSYMVESRINIELSGVGTYKQLLNDYDPALMQTLQGINS